MTSTAQLVILFMIYYVVIGIGISAIGYGDLITDERVESNVVYAGSEMTYNTTIEDGAFSLTEGINYILAFATLGVNLGLGGFGNFLVVLLFVWIPGVIMALLGYYSIRSGSS